jgi:hypothetical protein
MKSHLGMKKPKYKILPRYLNHRFSELLKEKFACHGHRAETGDLNVVFFGQNCALSQNTRNEVNLQTGIFTVCIRQIYGMKLCLFAIYAG